MTALAKWDALHEVLDPPSSSLPGLTGSRGNVADEEELCSIMSARCWMPSSMPMAKNFATTIECVYSVCFLIVIGEAAARGERAEGSVATGTPLLPQRLAAQRICRILRARRYGSQRKLFPSFRGAAVRYSQRFYFPPPLIYKPSLVAARSAVDRARI